MNVHNQTRVPYDENSPAKSLKEDKKEFYLRMKKNKRILRFKSFKSYHLHWLRHRRDYFTNSSMKRTLVKNKSSTEMP